MRSQGWDPHCGISACTRRGYALSTIWRHSQKAAKSESQEEDSPQNLSMRHPSEVKPSELCEINASFLCHLVGGILLLQPGWSKTMWTHAQGQTEERRPCDSQGRDWSYAVQARKHQELPEATRGKEECFLRAFRGSQHFKTSKLKNCEIINFCCFKSSSLYALSWNFWGTNMGSMDRYIRQMV